MVIILNHNITASEKKDLQAQLRSFKLRVEEIAGTEETILGAIGHVTVDPREIELLDGVSKVIPISKPYKMASREYQQSDSIINLKKLSIGNGRITVIGGPCAIESAEQIMECARIASAAGAVILRGGAYKPRTSPYAFQGLKEEGLKFMKLAGEKYRLPIMSEIMSSQDRDIFNEYVDIIQIGARNMQNFELLRAVGSMNKIVMLKRGFAAKIEEWLMSAEYLLDSGTKNIILCERGIRSFETITRNTLDLSAIPVVKSLSHLPIIVDPSHGTGLRNMVSPMALAGLAAGADGVVVEMHPEPDKALSDGPQSLYPSQFEKLVKDIQGLSLLLNKELQTPPSAIENRRMELGAAAIKIAFQGEPGAYSELAISNYFADTPYSTLPCKNFKASFDAVLKQQATYAIIPLENTLAGSIVENYDFLKSYQDLSIVGEIQLSIKHCLIANLDSEFKDIKIVKSHYQALAQCAQFLEEHNMETEAFIDTAGAVKHLAAKPSKHTATIASRLSARVYNMKILKENIETNPNNYTRFAIIQHKSNVVDTSDINKVSLVFSIKNKIGGLDQVLRLFTETKFNMSKLESRPIIGDPWNYTFYVDLHLTEEPATKEKLDNLYDKIKKLTHNFRELGRYKEQVSI